LNQVAVYKVEGEDLLMDLPADGGTLRLSSKSLGEKAKIDPNLLDKTWKWYQFTSPTSQVVVDDPNKYAVEFKPDGLVSVKTDCNNGGGIYAASGGNMNIEVNHMTMAACPPDSLGDPFVLGLNTVVVYRIEGDILLMDLPADGGTMLLSENLPVTQPPTDPKLVGTVWKWYQFQSPVGEKLLVPDPNQYIVEFMADGKVHVQADCNTGNGTYTAGGSNINIEVQAMTLAICAPGSFSDQFVQGLNTAAIYFFQGADLYMDLTMDSGTMQLSVSPPTPQPPQGDPNLVGKWNWTEFTSPAGEKIIVPDPTQYTVEFTASGTASAKADCNSGNGTYTADGSSINIQINALTRALCSPGSYSEQYVAALNNAALYFFQNGSLFMDLPMDSGTMKFVPGQ
jgi:heat shock protein HslJ